MGITVIGLGPADGLLLTREAWSVLESVEELYLRTEQHPAVHDLPKTIKVHSFDYLYEKSDSFVTLYEQIVAILLEKGIAATEAGKELFYAVPGHPFIAESTVTGLMRAAEEKNLPIRIIAGLSFIEPVLTAAGIDGLSGLQLFDALDILNFYQPPVSADRPVLIGQVYNRMVASELKLNLMRIYPDEHPVVFIHGAGSATEVVARIPLYEIDRTDQVSYLSSLYVPPLPEGTSIAQLMETVATLRGPNGCPWDQEQTAQSLRGDLLEEVGELLEEIEQDDPEGMEEELGDLLFHILMQVEIGAEEGYFTFIDVIRGIDQKLKYRHPHVWGDVTVADSAEVVENWEKLKIAKKGALSSLLENIPLALPSLMRAQKIQKRVRKVGFDWPTIDGVWEKIQEEILEIKEAESLSEQTAELGDLLFAIAHLANWLQVDAEIALREANGRFMGRFQLMEQFVQMRGKSLDELDVEQLEALWDEAKRHQVAQ